MIVDPRTDPILSEVSGLAATVRERSWSVGDDYVRGQSGLYLPVVESPGRRRRAFGDRPIAMDFFAGAGGMSLGFHQAGFHVVAAAEKWPTAAMTYLCNLGKPTTRIVFIEDEDRVAMEKTVERENRRLKKVGSIYTPVWGEGWISARPDEPACEVMFIGDIRKMTGQGVLAELDLEAGDLDCVMGGPPCQGFSTAGRRNVYDPRNSLVFEYARMVCELHPATMIMENVPNIASMVTPEGIPVVDAFCSILEQGGMGAYDALRKSLLGDPAKRGAVAGAKTTGPRSIRDRTKAEAKVKTEQVEAAHEAAVDALEQLAMAI